MIGERIVIENPVNGIPVPVPKHLNYTDQLTQHTAEYLARVARIPGFNFDYTGPATSEDFEGPSDDEET
jgi:hypothetical protein